MIYYEVIDANGQGLPWIIMVHGFTHNNNYFLNQVLDFQKDHWIFLVDLRGHGKSDSLEGPYGIEEYADDILAALDDAGIKTAHYWGSHTGSAIGLVLALRYPERFATLTLEGTFLPGFDMPLVDELIDRAHTIAKSKGVEEALEDWFSHSDFFEYIREHPQICRAKEHRNMLFEFSGDPWLSDLEPRQVTAVAEHLDQIRMPVLVYNGNDDMNDFKRAASYMEAGLPNVQCEEISESGGFPAWENPKAVNKLVRGFLNKQQKKVR